MINRKTWEEPVLLFALALAVLSAHALNVPFGEGTEMLTEAKIS